MACNRCPKYEFHCDFLDNWLASINNNPNVTTGEIYVMALWCKSLRYEMISLHMMQFGKDLLVALELATWELELASTLRFFKSVPKGFNTKSVELMIMEMKTPISSFSSLLYAQKFGIKTYAQLQTIFKDLGLGARYMVVQFHHIIPVKFRINPDVVKWLGSDTNNWKCIVVWANNVEHTPKFTQPWKDLIGHGNKPGSFGVTTSTATLNQIKDAARIVYKDYPEILKAYGL